jgi:hypothetical protein
MFFVLGVFYLLFLLKEKRSAGTNDVTINKIVIFDWPFPQFWNVIHDCLMRYQPGTENNVTFRNIVLHCF